MIRSLGLAPRGGVLLIALAIVAGPLAARTAPGLAAAVVLAVFVLLAAYDVAILAEPLEIRRTALPRLVLARAAELRYEIRNGGPHRKHVELVEAPAAKVDVALEETRVTVPPHASLAATIAVVPRERGRTALRSYHARVRSGLGIVERRLSWSAPADVRVAPDISALDRSGDLFARAKLLERGLRRMRRTGIAGEFAGLREYAPGDAFGAIAWKASAHRGKTMVVQTDAERGRQIVLALDAGRLMAPRLGATRKIDHAVSAALNLAAFSRLAGDRTGVYAFAAAPVARVLPGTGSTHAARVFDALADLEPRNEESDYERAVLDLDRSLRRRSLVVLFTEMLDPAASANVLGAVRALSPRHLVLVVLLNDAAIADALEREPLTTDDAYRAAVATTLALERQRAVATLRRRGVLVVDVPAERLVLALLDAYVAVKTRTLL